MNLSTSVFPVSGLTNSGGTTAIESHVSKLPGVKVARFDSARTYLIVDFDASLVSENDIISCINDMGHQPSSTRQLLQKEIEDRKKAEKALQENEKNFRAIIETIPVAIYLSKGVEQKATYMNPTMEKLFGYTIEDIPSSEQWWPLAYPDETYRQKIAEEWNLRVKDAIKAQSSIAPMETMVNCKDGAKKNILWNFITLGDKNYAFGLDLTERKKAEEAMRINEEYFKNIFEYSTVGKSITTLDGKIRTNQTFQQILGYTDEELSTTPWSRRRTQTKSSRFSRTA